MGKIYVLFVYYDCNYSPAGEIEVVERIYSKKETALKEAKLLLPQRSEVVEYELVEE